MTAPVLCDFCDALAVAVSEGVQVSGSSADSRRARCADHRVLGGALGMAPDATRAENDWIRDKALDLDDDVLPMMRKLKASTRPKPGNRATPRRPKRDGRQAATRHR